MKKNNDFKCTYYFFNEYENILLEKKIVNKIVKNDFFITNELTNVEKLYNYKEFYYVCEKSSKLKITKYNHNSNYLTSGEDIKDDDMLLLRFENRDIQKFKNYLKNMNSPTIYVYNVFIDFYRTFLKSLHMLVEQKIVHNNINIDTIVIDKYDSPLLSRFLFSLDISNSNIYEYFKYFFLTYFTIIFCNINVCT